MRSLKLKWCLRRGTTLALGNSGGTHIVRGFIILNEPSCEGLLVMVQGNGGLDRWGKILYCSVD